MQSTDGLAFCFGRNLHIRKVLQIGPTGNFMKLADAKPRRIRFEGDSQSSLKSSTANKFETKQEVLLLTVVSLKLDKCKFGRCSMSYMPI